VYIPNILEVYTYFFHTWSTYAYFLKRSIYAYLFFLEVFIYTFLEGVCTYTFCRWITFSVLYDHKMIVSYLLHLDHSVFFLESVRVRYILEKWSSMCIFFRNRAYLHIYTEYIQVWLHDQTSLFDLPTDWNRPWRSAYTLRLIEYTCCMLIDKADWYHAAATILLADDLTLYSEITNQVSADTKI